MLEQKIIDAYNTIQDDAYITYNNSDEVSFDGSQIQQEFFEAWNYISEYYNAKKPKILKFLEVGAWKGLWGIAFTEFCKINKIKGEYVTITMMSHDPNNRHLWDTLKYINQQPQQNATLIDMNTFNEDALSEVTKNNTNYNIVFIDAGHKYEEAKNDISKFSSLATDLLLFHDIRPKKATEHCGVYQAICDAGINLTKEISTTDLQMGIGIKYII